MYTTTKGVVATERTASETDEKQSRSVEGRRSGGPPGPFYDWSPTGEMRGRPGDVSPGYFRAEWDGPLRDTEGSRYFG